MLTTRLTGEKIPDYDSKIEEFLTNNEFNDSDDLPNTVIGIDNLKGKLYRYIEINGMDDSWTVIEFLEEVLDLVDVLSFGARVRYKGCDNRYRPNGVMINGLATFRTQGYAK